MQAGSCKQANEDLQAREAVPVVFCSDCKADVACYALRCVKDSGDVSANVSGFTLQVPGDFAVAGSRVCKWKWEG